VTDTPSTASEGREAPDLSMSRRQRLSDALLVAAEAACRCLSVSAGEAVLIVCNQPQRVIAEALAHASAERGGKVSLVEFPPSTRPSEEPPDEIARAMTAAAVVFAATTFSLSHTTARREATSHGVRIATLPSVTPELFTRLLPIDYEQLRRTGIGLADRLSAAERCLVTSPAGTDIALDLSGRVAVCDAGDLSRPGAFGNLPAGEAFIAPLETVANGRIVFDGSLSGYGLLKDPVIVEVRDGRAIDASGEVGRWLLDSLDAGGENGRLIAELGIGTNPRAGISGRMIEDEKAVGTAHLAFGTSASFGGATVAGVHLDGLVHKPTILLDDRLVLNAGVPVDIDGISSE
jgi:leucyl aminopeptidase (aminopeptidase T)